MQPGKHLLNLKITVLQLVGTYSTRFTDETTIKDIINELDFYSSQWIEEIRTENWESKYVGCHQDVRKNLNYSY